MNAITTNASADAIVSIDEPRLETDLAYRFDFLCRFIGFGPEDIEAVHGAAKWLAPRLDDLVDAVYEHLFRFDATKRYFLIPGERFAGEMPASLDELTLDHEYIRFRKNHLKGYLRRLVTADYDAQMLIYLDFVGRIHTRGAGNLAIHVPLVEMTALMGFVSDALIATFFSLDVDDAVKERTIRAFQKLLWIQFDLIARHYTSEAI